MTFKEIRNIITTHLEEFLEIPVVLSDQVAPVPDFPLCYYSVISPYASTGEMGNYLIEDIDGETDVKTIRQEQPNATFSFTVCSINRWSKDENGEDTEPYIFGEDEAQSLAEKAQSFFLLTGYDILSNLGIVVADVTNTANRTTLMVDESARRWGFDVRIRYTREDSRKDRTIDKVSLIRKKE